MVIPDNNIFALYGGQDSHTQGLPSALLLSCLSQCCQMFSEFTHHRSVTKINKHPELPDCISEALRSALRGMAVSEQCGSSSGGLRLGSGGTSSLTVSAAYAVEATACPNQHPPCLSQPPLLLIGSTAGSSQEQGECHVYCSRGLLWRKSSFSVSWWYFRTGCLGSASVYVSVSKVVWVTPELQNFVDF